MSSIELISFKLCPFVQRSVITLLEKKVPFDITYIELDNKPDWFLKISPTGKVPVLKAEGEVLFESAVINEYLDEVTPPTLHPSNPLVKAKHRAWIEFSSGLFMGQYRMIHAVDRETTEEERENLARQLTHLEGALGEGPLFCGDEFSLVDAAVAPLFMRADLHSRHYGVDILDGLEKLKKWQQTLLARDSVRFSVVDDFEELTLKRMKKSPGWLANKA